MTPAEFFGEKKSAELLRALEKALGRRFSSPDAPLRALAHRSLCGGEGKVPDNERLEFLGDAVVNYLVVDELFRRYPGDDEGKLSALKSKLVGTGAFARCSAELGLPELLQMSESARRSGTRERLNIREDVFEAVMGALYLDGGLEAVREVLGRVLFVRFEEWGRDDSLENWKGILNERLQAAGLGAARYRVVGTEGPAHALRFVVEVLAGDRVLARGEGTTKLGAEQAAAREATRNRPDAGAPEKEGR